MRNALVVLAVALSASVAPGLAQAPASPLRIVKDVRKTCQIAVPSDWMDDTSTGYSPGKKVSATVHGMAGQTFDDGKTVAKQAMKPIKILEDTPKRLMYTMDPGTAAPGKTGWYIILNTTPVCTASFTFGAGTDEAMLKTIADSLGVAK